MNSVKRARQKLSEAKNRFAKASRPMQVAIIAIVLVVVYFTYTNITKSKNGNATYKTGTVERGSVISTLSESGNVSSNNQTNISSPTNGVVQEVYVKNGDVVAAGQNLFKVKSTATEQEKASAYASYLSAVNNLQTAQQSKQASQASLETARKTVLDAQSAVDSMELNLSNGANNPSTKQPYTQNEKDSLYSALTSAKQNFTATETKYKQADTAISVASANQTSAWLDYQANQDTIVTAPISGTVANFSATIGTAVKGTGANNTSTSNSSNSNSSSSSSSSSTATTVLVLGNFDKLNIIAPVSEVDISKIKAGQKATITLDAFPDKTYAGQVESVDTIGTATSGVVTFNAYITFVSPSPEIQPGMTATAVIQLDRHDDVLFVPSTAVQTGTNGAYVRELKNGTLTEVPVETGLTSDTSTEITSGLKEGETIVTSVTTTSTTSSTATTSPFSGTRGFGGGGFGGGAAVRRGN